MSRFSFTRGFIPIEAVYYSTHNNFITRESLKNHIMYLTESADSKYLYDIIRENIAQYSSTTVTSVCYTHLTLPTKG